MLLKMNNSTQEKIYYKGSVLRQKRRIEQNVNLKRLNRRKFDSLAYNEKNDDTASLATLRILKSNEVKTHEFSWIV